MTIYTLQQGDVLLATLETHDSSGDWQICSLRPEAAFEPFRALFADLNSPDEAVFQAAYARFVRLNLGLVDTAAGIATPYFMLRFDDDQVWLRCSFDT